MSKPGTSGRGVLSRVGLAVVLVGAFAFIGGSAGAVTGSASGFESSDGNMALTTVASPATNTDWNCFVQDDNFAKNFSTPTGCKATTGAHHILGSANGDIGWVSGQKFDVLCPALADSNNPPKDQFVDVASFKDSNAANDTFFYGATIRQSANGNASGDVEFNQSNGDGTTSTGCR